jgi:hypothetical protein
MWLHSSKHLSGQIHAPATLPLRKDRQYFMDRRMLGGPRRNCLLHRHTNYNLNTQVLGQPILSVILVISSFHYHVWGRGSQWCKQRQYLCPLLAVWSWMNKVTLFTLLHKTNQQPSRKACVYVCFRGTGYRNMYVNSLSQTSFYAGQSVLVFFKGGKVKLTHNSNKSPNTDMS